MLTPISTNISSPVRPALESPTHKQCHSAESKKLDVELAAKVKSLKDGAKARKESKGPILKRKMACATCRRRKLRCDAARPRCSTCARSQASAEAAGHPSAVPPGPCSYDCDSHDEPVPNRFFANGSFHSLTFHSHPRMPMTPGFGMPGPYDAMTGAPMVDSLNYLPPTSPHGVWAYGDFPMTPSRVPGPGCNPSSCHTTPLITTPTRPTFLTSTPMRRIISPSLAINSTPVQEHDVFYSPPAHEQWTPSSAMSTDSVYYSPMVASLSEGLASVSGLSSAASTPSLASTRAIRSPFHMSQDIGTPLSMPPTTPISDSFDVHSLGPPMVPRATLSPHEQQIKCTNFLQSLEPMPYNLIDFSGAGALHVDATAMMPSPMMSTDSVEIMAGNDLGLINGGAFDGKLQDPFSTFSGLEMPDASLLASAGAADMSGMTLTSAMPTDMFVSAANTPVAPEWVA
ncbi:putative fungal zinc cluster transcription factor [Pseudozyma hubeiensis]|nr:putative fungal zinc cluster transcription factor [Pseudozyma hubeiensis]